MNKAEQEKARRAFRKAFNSCNRHWEFNGRTFETSMELYRSHIWIRVIFESGPFGVTVWMHAGRAFKEAIDIDGPQRTFGGDNAMANALNFLSDCYLQAIGRVRELEQEALKQIVPQIPPEAFREIFSGMDQETA